MSEFIIITKPPDFPFGSTSSYMFHSCNTPNNTKLKINENYSGPCRKPMFATPEFRMPLSETWCSPSSIYIRISNSYMCNERVQLHTFFISDKDFNSIFYMSENTSICMRQQKTHYVPSAWIFETLPYASAVVYKWTLELYVIVTRFSSAQVNI
jgi:hypothetical protein